MLSSLKKLIPRKLRKSAKTVHVLRLEGGITTGRSLGSTAINFEALEPLLKKAFVKGIDAVVLQINCPGGSPVQSALIGRRIRALSVEHKTPVLAFCEDVAASGGYWLACAADEIYADENSIIGSIGVISMGFGFAKAMEKLGVERRVHTAGESKSTNDPFKPEKPEDVAKLKAILEEMHESFKAEVRARRGAKLAEDREIFTGAFWTGAKAQKLGLIDGVAHMHEVLKDRFGEKVEIQRIKAAGGLFKSLGFGGAEAAVRELPTAALQSVEERALWSRFGL